MPDFRRARCVPKRGGCGRHASEVGLISWGGLCGDCARAKFLSHVDTMHGKSGPELLHWRRAVAASVGGVLVDDLEALVDDSG